MDIGRRLVSAAAFVYVALSDAAAGDATIREADFRDRVYACWLGKALGGTLGQPVEGQQGPHDVPPTVDLSPGIANDEADLELLWLVALEENDARVDARKLGEYWLRYVTVDWSEYGVGKKNLRLGLLPPLTGEFRNPWKHSNGAWARADVWGCLAPGRPALAARLAWEDASVDHGVANEGTLAAMFIAALESAAFVESDRERLIAIGLSVVPDGSELSRALRAALAAWKAGKDWKTARQEVIDVTKTGWFMAPRDVAFIVIGWLYGEGDYRRTLVTTLNCGDDSDSTVATVASILGIVGGTRAIDPVWRESVGDRVKTCILSEEFRRSPGTVSELTDRTVAMAKRILEVHSAPVRIAPEPTDLRLGGEVPAGELEPIRDVLGLPQFSGLWAAGSCEIRIDYRGEPIIEKGAPRKLSVSVRGDGVDRMAVAVAPPGWRVLCADPAEGADPGRDGRTFDVTVTAPEVDAYVNELKLVASGSSGSVAFPAVLLGAGLEPAAEPAQPPVVESSTEGNLALASNGAVATSDGELDREPGSTPKVIDGLIGGEGNRWHSSIATPHPHWVQVTLPKASAIGRVIIHFADPRGRPVDFRGLVAPGGGRELVEVLRVTGNEDPRVWRGRIEPVTTDTFRLVIDRSVNPVSPNAAQISEIELLAPEAEAARPDGLRSRIRGILIGDPVRSIVIAANDRNLDAAGNLESLRDVDCSAGVAGALVGALRGVEAFPADWVADTVRANRAAYGIDLEANANRLHEVLAKRRK